MLDDKDAPAAPAPALSQFIGAVPFAVYATDAEGMLTGWNRAASALWGVEPRAGAARWCGAARLLRSDGEPLAPRDSPTAAALRGEAAPDGREAIVERPDGTRANVRFHPSLLRDPDGTAVGSLTTLVDVSREGRDLEFAPRLSAIVESSHDAIVSKDLAGVIRTWNAGARRVFGYEADEVVGRSITILIPPDRLDEEPRILERIRNGELVDHFETVRVRKDGTRIPISLTISPILAADGRIVGVSKIARDISQQKESEQRIRALLREVNHRVKNQFAVILSMLRETGRRAGDPREFERKVRERIMALSRSHDLLVQGDWRGATVFELLLCHARPAGNEALITMAGPSLMLQPMAVQYLGIAFHELVSNSARFGAMSGRGGSVHVEWSVADRAAGEPQFGLVWEESGIPGFREPDGKGFGGVALERLAPASISGEAELLALPDGLRWRLKAPLRSVEARLEGLSPGS